MCDPGDKVEAGKRSLYVLKAHHAHNLSWVWKGTPWGALQLPQDALVFESYGEPPRLPPHRMGRVVHKQRYDDIVRLGLGGALFGVMAPLFGLPAAVTRDVHEHMKYWEVLRRCCGTQQSADHRLELHGLLAPAQGSDGSNGSAAAAAAAAQRHSQGSSYDAADCDTYRLPSVEQRLLGTRLGRLYPAQLWLAALRPEERVRPGNCLAWERDIRGGVDFNGRMRYAPPPAAAGTGGPPPPPPAAAGTR